MLVTAISPLDKNVFNANVLLQFKILTHGALATFTVTAFLQSHLTTHFVLLLPLLHPPISINTLTNITKNRPTLVGFKIPQKILYLTPSLCSILTFCILPPLAGVQKSPRLSTLEVKLRKSRALTVLNCIPLERHKVRKLFCSGLRRANPCYFLKSKVNNNRQMRFLS